jgi:hypothetical protein
MLHPYLKGVWDNRCIFGDISYEACSLLKGLAEKEH